MLKFDRRGRGAWASFSRAGPRCGGGPKVGRRRGGPKVGRRRGGGSGGGGELLQLREKQKRLLEQPLLRQVKHAVLVQLRLQEIWAPSNRWLARLFRSGKYKEYVVKGHLTIAMGPGFPIRYTGPHIGVRHDARIFQEDRFLQARIKPWEYGLGDKAYVGQRQIITEWKGRNLSLEKQRFNKTVQHYRGRVEHLIGQVVDNRMALCTLRGVARSPCLPRS